MDERFYATKESMSSMEDTLDRVTEEAKEKAEDKAQETLEKKFFKAGTQRGQLYAVFSNAYTLVQTCLSFINAVNKGGFKFATFEQFIFGGSAVMEIAGLLFAFFIALYAYSEENYGIGRGGSPLVMVRMARADKDDELMRIAVFPGFGLQALAIWLCLTAYLFKSDLIEGGTTIFILSVAFVRALWNIIQGHTIFEPESNSGESRSSGLCHMILTLGHLVLALSAFLAPVALELIESYLLLADENSTEEVGLALLDIVSVLCGLQYILTFFRHELPRMWETAMKYHS